MSTLITGSAGFIVLNPILKLVKKRRAIIVCEIIMDFLLFKPISEKTNFIKGSVANANNVRKAIKARTLLYI